MSKTYADLIPKEIEKKREREKKVMETSKQQQKQRQTLLDDRERERENNIDYFHIMINFMFAMFHEYTVTLCIHIRMAANMQVRDKHIGF